MILDANPSQVRGPQRTPIGYGPVPKSTPVTPRASSPLTFRSNPVTPRAAHGSNMADPVTPQATGVSSPGPTRSRPGHHVISKADPVTPGAEPVIYRATP